MCETESNKPGLKMSAVESTDSCIKMWVVKLNYRYLKFKLKYSIYA